LSYILLIICNRFPAHRTPLLSNATCSSSRSLSLPSHSSSLPSSSTPPLPLLDNPRYLSINQTLRLTNPTLLERQRKDFNGYHFVQLSSLSKRMTGSIHEVTERLNESGTRYNVNTSVSAYFGFIRTPPEEIHWNG